MTRHLLVLGTPAARAVEPAFVAAALALVGVEVTAEAATPAGPALVEAVRSVRGKGVLGAVVGAPLEEKVAGLVDRLSDDARTIGAADTLSAEGTRVVGHALTGGAVRGALDRLVGRQRLPKAAVVLGAGGTGRAVVHTLITSGFLSVVVFDHRLHRAEALVRHFARSSAHMELRARPWHEAVLEAEISRTKLLVDAGSSEGPPAGPPVPEALLVPDLFVLDADASRRTTALVEAARRAGATNALGGDDLLLARVAAMVELWTGRRPDPEALTGALASCRPEAA